MEGESGIYNTGCVLVQLLGRNLDQRQDKLIVTNTYLDIRALASYTAMYLAI